MPAWSLDRIAIGGGFLNELSLQLPTGLICIIGPRGSGKSTLAEAIRITLSGLPPASAKSRSEMIKANLGGSVVSLTTRPADGRSGFTIRRTYGQTAVITADDSRPVTNVEIDRGTFLPIDAYSSADIEALADETLGSKRRSLLDDLRASELQTISMELAGHGRALEANAEAIRATERRIREITEQIEELGDVNARLAALPVASSQSGSPAFQEASRQKQMNEREVAGLLGAKQQLEQLDRDIEKFTADSIRVLTSPLAIEGSSNTGIIAPLDQRLEEFRRTLEDTATRLRRDLLDTRRDVERTTSRLREAHASQEARYLSLQHENHEAVQAFEARASAERQFATAATLQEQRESAVQQFARLQQERKIAKAAYILTRDRVSALRESVAAALQSEAGSKVRIRVKRNADVLGYQQLLLSALYGSKLKNQEDILKSLCAIRPEDLAVMLREDDLDELETHTAFGKERSRRILDLLRQGIDTLALEVLPIDDQVLIELNVSSGAALHFKDASELSRGQKCTALLPIILARRDTPLLVDQPEDNLDNHFIYETVVESIRRLKARRQLIFITHNANIPVLGEAELVVVMNSDGKRGFIEKTGTVDDCRNEIIDLLEGGEEAFELRRKRYGAK